MKKKLLIVIGGPTASGKTTIAIEVAKKLNAEIISADSRQCYQELQIGVGRPNEEELNSVPHHFIAQRSICNPLDAWTFMNEARAIATRLIENNQSVVLVGGTGLYLKAFLHGLDALPGKNDLLRKELEELYQERGVEGLKKRYAQFADVALFKENANHRRLIRAIEVYENTPKRIPTASFQLVDALKFRVSLETSLLYQRIHQRIDEMIAKEWEIEAMSLYNHPCMQKLPTVGYSEWFQYFNGVITREKTIALIKQKTRNYAKRQNTWFKNQDQYIPIQQAKAIFDELKNHGY